MNYLSITALCFLLLPICSRQAYDRKIQQWRQDVSILREVLVILSPVFYIFFIVISFAGNSVVISLYSVEFLQFLLATPLHWIQCKFYLFVCVQSASYLMYYIALFGTIFLCLSFYTSEPYP